MIRSYKIVFSFLTRTIVEKVDDQAVIGISRIKLDDTSLRHMPPAEMYRLNFLLVSRLSNKGNVMIGYVR